MSYKYTPEAHGGKPAIGIESRLVYCIRVRERWRGAAWGSMLLCVLATSQQRLAPRGYKRNHNQNTTMIGHSFDFDPTCGYTRQELLALTPPDTEPADFAEFWQGTCDATQSLPLDVRLRRIWSPATDTDVFELSYESFGGARVGAFLTRPRISRGGLVVGHGYGGLSSPVFHRDMTVIAPCIRGFNLSSSPDVPWRSAQHVLHGIECRDTYVIRGSVADLWRAASVLLQLAPEAAENLVYSGGSFGGGLGALALPWDKRFRAAYLDVPTFGHHPMRLQYKSTGSAESVRVYHQSHPEVAAVLAYFDAATAAGYIRIPVVCTPALFDPAVIPPGQFAVNNGIRAELRQTFVLQAGHWTHADDEPVKRAAAAARDALFGLTP